MMLPDVIGHENQSQQLYQHHQCLWLDLSGRITTPDRFSYHTGRAVPPPPIPFLLCTLLSDCFPHITFQTTVRDLGVTLDSALNFSQQNSQLNSLLLLPTEASENHSQSCIGSYFPLYYTCPWGPSIKYVTLFLANFGPPPPLSHFVPPLGPPPTKYVTSRNTPLKIAWLHALL